MRRGCRRIVVLSAVEAEDFECETKWACISIATTPETFIRLHRRRRKGLMQLAFADVDKPLPGFVHFSTDHAHDILDFVTNTWSQIDTLLVHCEAGLSRSPAIAAAVARLKRLEYQEFFEYPYIPNHLVYRTLLEVASGRGDYE